MALVSRSERSVNGARSGSVVASGGLLVASPDPMARVLSLDAQTTTASAWMVYALGAVALWLALVTAARAAALYRAWHPMTAQTAAAPQEIEIVRDEPAPAPPAPTQEEAKPEPAPPPPAARTSPHEAPAPAPAQAARVLTQAPDPNEPVDLTGNTIVSGNADVYAGGVTAANGTSRGPVRGVTSPVGAPNGNGTSAEPPGPDRSRPPALEGGDWGVAPFPPEADADQIDHAVVRLRISVNPNGSVSNVDVLKDPGHGFGREARKRAFTKRYAPALDRSGQAVAGAFQLNVTYDR